MFFYILASLSRVPFKLVLKRPLHFSILSQMDFMLRRSWR